MKKVIAVEWNSGRPQGQIKILNGKLGRLALAVGKGRVTGPNFSFTGDGSCRLKLVVSEARTRPGSDSTIVTVQTRKNPFSFFLRDVTADNPIYIPGFGVFVTAASDTRSYTEIEQAIGSRGLQTNLERIESEPEETFADAAAHTRAMKCETWLGLSRDMRIFALHFRGASHRWDWIEPRFHGYEVKTPETPEKPGGPPNFLKYGYMIGRGFACTEHLTRRLEDGVLPILHATLVEEDIRYNLTAFATLEKRALVAKNVRGTHFLVADGHGHGHMFTDEQKKEYERRLPEELGQDEETVLCVQINAVNTGKVPRYAWYFAPALQVIQYGLPKDQLDENGFASFESGRVFCVNRLNGKPLRQREIAVLVQPGEAAVFEFIIPHRPVSKQRAARLATFDFAEKHAECAAYWRAKLDSGATLQLPEPRINEMARAGLLHLDVVAYGREPKAPIAATIGHYNPIGSESSPIIQFFDSMGWHDVAERALQYFLDKQHDDGFIQNFGGYMLETGPALWSMGEHWRYTRDLPWLKRIAPKLLKSADFLLRWRERNKRPELRGTGYGMLEGKVADPEDHFRQFMLNGYGYLGLKRVAEMLAIIQPRESRRIAREAERFRRDIRIALAESFARAPVVPLGDGSWVPTCPPWVEDVRGPLCLYAQNLPSFTHGTFMGRDSMIGPLYLILSEVLDAREAMGDWLVNYHADLMTDRNAAFSQPYYARHDFAHIQRGEVKAFLKTYYNQFASLADRETYTFWEHYFGASPHKTHEEGWFLMQTRWMLWMEEGDRLRLLPGVPRAWLEHGKTIELKNVASYFGPISLRVESKLHQGKIEAWIECKSNRQPGKVKLRLPHPEGARAKKASGGVYCADNETVCVERFRNSAKILLRF
jgi:hypothetical protein